MGGMSLALYPLEIEYFWECLKRTYDRLQIVIFHLVLNSNNKYVRQTTMRLKEGDGTDDF